MSGGSSGLRLPHYVAGGATFVTTFAALWLVQGIASNEVPWWLLLIPLPAVLLGYHYRERLDSSGTEALVGLMTAMLVIFSINIARLMIAKVTSPSVFDFSLFWAFARAAVLGQNFYIQETGFAAVNAINFDVSVGANQFFFWYPPQSMLLLLPFGWFDTLSGALAFWYGVDVLLFLAALYLLWDTFLRRDGLIGLLLVAVIMASLHALYFTVQFGQTLLLMLVFLLLYWRDRNSWRGGVWLGLTILVKPLMACLALYVLLRRHWGTMAGLIGTAAVTSVLALVLFGADTFMSYFNSRNPVFNDSMPAELMYAQPFNQSLVATVSRLTDFEFGGSISPLMQPLVIVGTVILLLGTAFLIMRMDGAGEDWLLVLTMFFGLMVYPHSVGYYAILFLLLFLLLWRERASLPGGLWTALGIVMLLYVIVGYKEAALVFWAYLIAWSSLAVLIVRAEWGRGKQPSPSAVIVEQPGSFELRETN